MHEDVIGVCSCIYLCMCCQRMYKWRPTSFSCIFTLQEENLDEQVAEKNINYPYIAVVTMDFSVNMFLAVEHEIVCSVDSVFQPVQLLLSTY